MSASIPMPGKGAAFHGALPKGVAPVTANPAQSLLAMVPVPQNHQQQALVPYTPPPPAPAADDFGIQYLDLDYFKISFKLPFVSTII